MKRLLTVLMVLMALGFVVASCSGDELTESAAGTGEGETAEVQPESQPITAPTDKEEVLDESSVDTSVPEQVEDSGVAPTTVPAEEMIPDELNVAYFLKWPTANQVAQAEKTYDEALGLTVNWISFASGGDMARAMVAGDIDIAYSQDLISFASTVTDGSDLLLVGVAVGVSSDDVIVAGGDAVMPGAEQEIIGGRVFGVISTVGMFAAEYPDIITGFLQVTEDANRAYNDDRSPLIDIIAEEAAMDRDAAIALLDAFTFPSKDVQLSEAWLGGTAQQVMKEQMEFLAAQGKLEFALPAYDAFVDTRFLEAVS